MTLRKLVPIVTVLLVGLGMGCIKNSNNRTTARLKSSVNLNIISSELPSDKIPYSVKPLNGIYLGIAGNFVILSETGISDAYNSTIIGDIGACPITGAAILVSCVDLTGTVYTVDKAGPFPCSETNPIMLRVALGNMQAAYIDAINRINPCFLELSKGDIGSLILTPGLYKWTTDLAIPKDITISGGPNDVWIFQIYGTLTLGARARIILKDGAQAKNIFWATHGKVTLKTASHFEGNILGKTSINLQNGATITGRMLSQSTVTLHMNKVTLPK